MFIFNQIPNVIFFSVHVQHMRIRREHDYSAVAPANVKANVKANACILS